MKKALLLATDGFEEIEALSVIDVLRRAGVFCAFCAVTNQSYLTGSHNITVQADLKLENLGTPKEIAEEYDAIVLPGGMPGAENLKNHDGVISVLQAFAEAGKITAAICAAPIALERAGLLEGKQFTIYPGCLQDSETYFLIDAPVVCDGNVITGKAPAAALEFSYTLVKKLLDEEAAMQQKRGMYYI